MIEKVVFMNMCMISDNKGNVLALDKVGKNYSGTTVLASQGSGIDNFDHAVSQLPYVLIGAGISIIGFLVLGFVM